MKRILLLAVIAFSFIISKGQSTLPFPLPQSVGNDSTLLNVHNIIINGIIYKAYSDTTAANASHFGYYNGSNGYSVIFTTIGGITEWYRYNNTWVILAGNGAIPSVFNPIQGYGMLLTGSYPNITFKVDSALLMPKSDSQYLFITPFYLASKGYGTVSNVAVTNGNGINASVASPTTTPNITIAIDPSTYQSIFHSVDSIYVNTSTGDSLHYLQNSGINYGLSIYDVAKNDNRYAFKSIVGSVTSVTGNAPLSFSNSTTTPLGSIDTTARAHGLTTIATTSNDSAIIMAAVNIKKNISDSSLPSGYTTRTKTQQDSIALASAAGTVNNVVLNTPNVIFSTPVTFTTTSGTATGTLVLNNQASKSVLSNPSLSSGTPSFNALDSSYINGIHTQPYNDLRYQPLENQRLSTTNNTIFNSVAANYFNTLKSYTTAIPIPAHGNNIGDTAGGTMYIDSAGKAQFILKALLSPNQRVHDTVSTTSGIYIMDNDSLIKFATPRQVASRVIVNKAKAVGNLFSDNFARSSLGSNYTAVGGTYTFPSSAYLQLSAGNGTYNNYILNNNYISTHQHTDTVRFIPTVNNSTSFGVGIGVKSKQPLLKRDLIVQFSVATATLVGQIAICDEELFPTGSVAQSPALTFSVGDTLQGSYITNDTSIIATYTDLSTGASVSTSYGYLLTNVSNPLMFATGNPAMYNFGGTNNILYWSSTNNQSGTNDVFVGNSLLNGYDAGFLQNRYTNVAYNARTDYSIVGGPGDQTAQTLLVLPELASYNPLNVFIDVGVNDTGNNVSDAVFRANYDSICHYASNLGVTGYCVSLAPYVLNVTNYNSIIQSIASKYGFTYINIFSSLVASTGTTLNPLYDGGDGLHWNTAGHAVVAALFQSYRNRYSNNNPAPTAAAKPAWNVGSLNTGLTSAQATIGTGDATPFTIYTNGVPRAIIASTGGLQYGKATGTGTLVVDTAGQIGINAIPAANVNLTVQSCPMCGGTSIAKLGNPAVSTNGVLILQVDSAVGTTYNNRFNFPMFWKINNAFMASMSTGGFGVGTSAGTTPQFLVNASGIITRVNNTPGANGSLLIASTTGWIPATLTAGTGVQIVNGANSITIFATPTRSDTLKAQSGAISTISTFTPTTTGLFNISGMINVTALSLDVLQVQITYKDETGTTQTISWGSSISATGFTSLPTTTIWAQSGTAIVTKTTLTTGTGSIAYDIASYIEQKK